MPIYTYRCNNNHLTENFFPISRYERMIQCDKCDSVANIVILSAPHFNVDCTDREGFNVGAGQYFSNRSEKRQWMQEKGAYEISPEEAKVFETYRKDLQEARLDNAPPPEAPRTVPKPNLNDFNPTAAEIKEILKT